MNHNHIAVLWVYCPLLYGGGLQKQQSGQIFLLHPCGCTLHAIGCGSAGPGRGRQRSGGAAGRWRPGGRGSAPASGCSAGGERSAAPGGDLSLPWLCMGLGTNAAILSVNPEPLAHGACVSGLAGLCAQVAGLRASLQEAGQAAAAHGLERARLEVRDAQLAQVLAGPLCPNLLRQPSQTTGQLTLTGSHCLCLPHRRQRSLAEGNVTMRAGAGGCREALGRAEGCPGGRDGGRRGAAPGPPHFTLGASRPCAHCAPCFPMHKVCLAELCSSMGPRVRPGQPLRHRGLPVKRSQLCHVQEAWDSRQHNGKGVAKHIL